MAYSNPYKSEDIELLACERKWKPTLKCVSKPKIKDKKKNKKLKDYGYPAKVI